MYNRHPKILFIYLSKNLICSLSFLTPVKILKLKPAQPTFILEKISGFKKIQIQHILMPCRYYRVFDAVFDHKQLGKRQCTCDISLNLLLTEVLERMEPYPSVLTVQLLSRLNNTAVRYMLYIIKNMKKFTKYHDIF